MQPARRATSARRSWACGRPALAAPGQQTDRAAHEEHGEHDEDRHGKALHPMSDRPIRQITSDTSDLVRLQTDMRLLSLIALIVGVILIPTTLGVAKLDRDRDASALDRALLAETDEHGGALESYFARSRSIVLLTANSPAFANVLGEPGTRAQKVRRQSRNLREVAHHLRYLEQLYPTSIGEACFIDAHGEEFARAVRGKIAKPGDLSTTEEETPFFAPTFALGFGRVHQTSPYVSPDTKEWVVANATLIPQRDGRKRAFVHFEVTVESFRRAMGHTQAAGKDLEVRVVDARTGRVVIDSDRPQRVGAALGVPREARFAQLARTAGQQGLSAVGGRRVAYRRVGTDAGNVNDWIVVASAGTAPAASWPGWGPCRSPLLCIALALVVLGGLSLRAGNRRLEAHANADALTGLGNRRKLLADLERRVRATEPGGADAVRPQRLQELQRRVRPRGGRRAARPAGPRAGRRRRAVRRPRLPPRRRRVLRDRARGQS